MRKLLFIFVLISITLYACAQPDTDYEDLPEITTPSGTDGFVIYKGGSGYKMTYSTAFAAIIDSLQIHNDSLLSYDIRILFNLAAINWLSDTVFQHNLRLIDLETGGIGVWTKSSTNLSPTTSGDDILLATTEELHWVDATNGISYDGSDIVFTEGSTKIIGLSATAVDFYVNLLPSADNSEDIGNSLVSLNDIWSYQYSIKEDSPPGTPPVNTGIFYMDNADEKPYFKNSTTTYDLTSGSSDIKTMYAASIGRGLTGDSAQFQTGATYQRIWYAGPDSIQIDTCRAVADDNDSSVDMDYNIIFQEQRISGSWTNVWSTPITISGADAITTGEITTTFTIDKIPPYSWIEIIFEETTVKATSLSINVIGHYIQ